MYLKIKNSTLKIFKYPSILIQIIPLATQQEKITGFTLLHGGNSYV